MVWTVPALANVKTMPRVTLSLVRVHAQQAGLELCVKWVRSSLLVTHTQYKSLFAVVVNWN